MFTNTLCKFLFNTTDSHTWWREKKRKRKKYNFVNFSPLRCS